MKQLELFVCDNFAPEYQRILETEHLVDVSIVPFPCVCENRSGKPEVERTIRDHAAADKEMVIFCNRKCDSSRIEGSIRSRICSGDLCISNIADEEKISEVLTSGGYIVGPGKLMNWEKYLADTGLTKAQSARFFSEGCKELVYFDTGALPDARQKLAAFSSYLGMPSMIIPTGIGIITSLVLREYYAWRLSLKNEEDLRILSDMQAQCAEYAAILDVIGKITILSKNAMPWIGSRKSLSSYSVPEVFNISTLTAMIFWLQKRQKSMCLSLCPRPEKERTGMASPYRFQIKTGFMA